MKNTYLNPNVINQIDNLYLKAKMIVEGYMSGLHKSPYHGFSIEFSEHRAYGIGDEVKNIDWKLWSKTDKYYIKRFEEETNLLCHLFLDSSESMNFTSHNITKFDYKITKFEYAKMLSAALSYLIINQRDSLGFYIFDSKILTDKIPLIKNDNIQGEYYLPDIFNFINKYQTSIYKIKDYTDIKGIILSGAF